MIYRIYYEGKRKFALPVKNREELMALRNSKANIDTLAKVRQGDASAKPGLLQLAYNIGHVEGALAGCKSIGSYFFHDIDAYGSIDNGQLTIDNCKSESERIKNLILEKKDEIGLKMLERSASGGWHLVCERRRGTTILENQVRVATILQIEMDTSAKDLQRVVFSTSGSDDDLPYLDDCLFEEPMTAEECEKEYNLLKVRVMRGLEEVPAEAKKANKHYRPWEETNTNLTNLTKVQLDGPKGKVNGCAQKKDSCNSCSENNPSNPSHPCSDKCFKGIPYSEIIAEWWQRNGGEPQEGERNVKLYQLAVNLRAICDNNRERLLEIMPRLGLDEQELRSIVESACKEPPKGISKMLNGILREKGIVKSEKFTAVTSEQNINLMLWEWGAQIEKLSEDFPLLRDICKGLKRNQYPAALFVAGGLMMTLMTRCTYRFYHRPEELRRLNNSTLSRTDADEGGQQRKAQETQGDCACSPCTNLQRAVHSGHGELGRDGGRRGDAVAHADVRHRVGQYRDRSEGRLMD